MDKLTQLFKQLNDELVAHPITQNLWSFYSSRPPLHQFFIRVALAVAAVLLMMFLLVMPLANFASRAQADFQTASDNLVWMQNHQALASVAAVNQGKPLADIVRESTLSPYIAQLTPGSDMQITVTISEAPFNRLAEALMDLSRNNGISVSNATINRLASRSGYVSATLVMVRN